MPTSTIESKPYEYVAYVDEAGDPGLHSVKAVNPAGSSEWLILSAVVVRRVNEPFVLPWVKEILGQLRNPQARALHFAKIRSDEKKLMVCRRLADLPVRCFVVASNKKNMAGRKNHFAAKGSPPGMPAFQWFYSFLARLLLERVTRFVYYDSAIRNGEPRPMMLEVAERGGLKHDLLQRYFLKLRMQSQSGNLFLSQNDLEWAVFDPTSIAVYSANKRAGLQLADTVASAFFKACDLHDTPNLDPQFAMALGPRMARSPDRLSGKTAGYGVKLMPRLREAQLSPEQEVIFRYYGLK